MAFEECGISRTYKEERVLAVVYMASSLQNIKRNLGH